METFDELVFRFLVDYGVPGNGYLEAAWTMLGKVGAVYHVPARTMRRDARFRGYWQTADNKCGVRVDVQEKKADKVDETPGSSPGQALGGAIRAMSQKKDSTIVEGCGLAG